MRLLGAPEWLFLFFASLAGLALVALIAPAAGGNEQMNFQRAASIAAGNILIRPVPLPNGIARTLSITDRRFPEGIVAPYGYSRSDFDQLAALKLDKEHPTVVQPNAIAVLHPVSYVPQVPVIALGMALGMPPLAIFYLGRLIGLAAGVALTFFAIRLMPVHKHLLAAVALLPPMIFSRSTLDADQFNNGLAFLLLALIVREMLAEGPLRTRTFLALVLGAFVFAQAKTAYFLLPVLVVAIPAKRLPLPRLAAWALLIIPGIVASIAWILILRSTFSTAAYRTWSGVVVPEQQLQLVLADPLHFGAVILKTVFATPFIPAAILDFLGRFGPPVALPLPFFPVLALLLAGVAMCEGQQPHIPRAAKILALLIAFATVAIILTLLYLQWTRVGAPTVDGFNGRYLYPLVPLFLLALPAGKLRRPAPGLLVMGLALVGTIGTLFTTWRTYWT
jgi:uncharacterized membrane protein